MSHRREPDRGSGGGSGAGREHHGSSPDVGQGSAEARQAGDRAFGPPPSGPQWPGREVSDAERRGVPATDTQARTPLGVGTSTSRRAEQIAGREEEAGRRHHGLRGSGRPHGKPAPEHDTGVAPQAPIHEDSPHLPTGDQAG
ncbi:MAG TPA: hypothetical protein VE198_17030 [Actinoallomurus sp.]|jgi:hypothetical protein|nr:hypothetical protein [Actinoallomurus sp.]